MSAAARLRAALGTLLLGVFSFSVWVMALIWMSGVALTGLLLLPFVSFKDSHHHVGAPGMTACIRLTLSRLRVTYDPAFDPERRSVFCQNHISVLDGHVACGAIPHAFSGLMLHTHFRIPGYGWLMRLGKGIPVYPRASGRTAELSAAARDRVAYGLSILTFPEAGRTLDGNVREFKRGVFFMARDAGLPVVPIAVRGLYAINHKGSWLFRPGTIDVYVGEQIETAGLTDEQVAELAQRVQHGIDVYVRTGETALL
jgi:1-acyl-sn-glycerol-3-phosphate acyltransferase